MSRLIESIRLENGVFDTLAYHQSRMDRATSELFGPDVHIDLKQVLSQREIPLEGLYKCRIVYGSQVHSVEFNPYKYRSIRSLRVVEDDHVEYAHKFEKRERLDGLFRQRGDCDDILIIKRGVVTDAYYHNILFSDGHRWFTSDTPLLAGTMRQRLLDDAIIVSQRIGKEDVKSFARAKLINAMVGINGPEIDVSDIVF